MSFREKSAWISLISILVVSSVYFAHVPRTLNPRASAELLHGLFLCVIALVVIQVAAHTIVALLAPRDARTPKDERERLIELKATRIAYPVYVLGSLLAVSTIHLGANAMAMGYGVLLALVVGELVNYGARIVFFRRGI